LERCVNTDTGCHTYGRMVQLVCVPPDGKIKVMRKATRLSGFFIAEIYVIRRQVF